MGKPKVVRYLNGYYLSMMMFGMCGDNTMDWMRSYQLDSLETMESTIVTSSWQPTGLPGRDWAR